MANTNILYGWEVSPYTSKVETYFNYKKIPFKKKIPSIFMLTHKIKKIAGKPIMPVVFDEQGDALQDSTLIIDHFEKLYRDNPVLPSTPKQALVSRLIEFYSDEWLPMAALHYRWNYKENLDFILAEFGRSSLPYFPRFLQTMVAKKAGSQMASYLPFLGITQKTQRALEDNTESLLSQLDKHFALYPFVLGDRPTLGDFSLYGPIYAHLHRDPYPENLVAKHKHVLAWLERIKGKHFPVSGKVIADDQIPETLSPILSNIIESLFPLIKTVKGSLDTWAKDHVTGDRVPGKFGQADIHISGITEKRANIIFPFWKFQRLCDLYQGFNERDKQDSESLFILSPELGAIKQPIENRVRYNKCSLYLE